MAQPSHVPKFGDWESDNIPYTAYFETARMEKVNGVKFNPNDPQDNPEAFMFDPGFGDRNRNHSHDVPAYYGDQAHKQQHSHRRKASHDQKSFGHRSMTSESGSDWGNSDSPLAQQNQARTRIGGKKSKGERINSSSPSPGRAMHGRSNHSDDFSYRSAASIPKFGEWDERDPKSGEGFTIIFNKVKEEKHIAATNFPNVYTQKSNQTNNQKKETRSKICCCLF